MSAIKAANSEAKPATILLTDGTYTLDSAALNIACDGLVIRSASGHREKVIVRGPDEGPKATAAHIFLVPASNVVLADLTLGYCRFHGIQVRGEKPHNASGLHVHNCRLVNCNEQFIKGSSAQHDPVGARNGIIENCLFEFTSGWAYQYYTGGIDIHKGVNWIVRDNLFRNIRVPEGQKGMAEHAVHFWNRCPHELQNVVIERNHIINHPIFRRNDAPPAKLSTNIDSVKAHWFRNITAGDLHLTTEASPAIDKATADHSPALDIDHEKRPAGNAPDIGCDELQL